MKCWCGSDMRWREDWQLWQCRRTFCARDLQEHPPLAGPHAMEGHDPGDEHRSPL